MLSIKLVFIVSISSFVKSDATYDPRVAMMSACMSLDELTCIGTTSFLHSDIQRETDPNVIAYFNFENIYGMDASIYG